MAHNRRYKNERDIQGASDRWQHICNYRRPHSVLEGKPPCSRYTISEKKYPICLAKPEYATEEIVRKVHNDASTIRFKGKRYHAGKGLAGEYVAIKETDALDTCAIFFMDQFIKLMKLEQGV